MASVGAICLLSFVLTCYLVSSLGWSAPVLVEDTSLVLCFPFMTFRIIMEMWQSDLEIHWKNIKILQGLHVGTLQYVFKLSTTRVTGNVDGWQDHDFFSNFPSIDDTPLISPNSLFCSKVCYWAKFYYTCIEPIEAKKYVFPCASEISTWPYIIHPVYNTAGCNSTEIST